MEQNTAAVADLTIYIFDGGDYGLYFDTTFEQ